VPSITLTQYYYQYFATNNKNNFMKKNVGKRDQYIRIIIALIIAVSGVYFKSWWGLISFVPLVTAFTGLCPLYSLLGINTKPEVVK